MVGIESRIRKEYGDAYWEKNKQIILDRCHAPSYPKVYNSQARRDMRRHPLSYRPDEMKDAGVWDDVKDLFMAQPEAIPEEPSGAALGYDPDSPGDEPADIEDEEDDEDDDEDDDEEEDEDE